MTVSQKEHSSLKMSTIAVTHLPAIQSTNLFINPYAIEVLKNKKEELVEGIKNPDLLLNWLVDNGIFPMDKKVAMSYYRTRTEKNSRMLDILVSKGERACRLFFYPCLKLIEPEIYNSVKQYVSNVNDYVGDGKRQLVGYLLERDKEDLKRPVIEKVVKPAYKETLPKIKKVPEKVSEVPRPKEKPRSLPQSPKEPTTKMGSLSMFDAAIKGNLSLLEEILKGSNVNAVNSSNETLLHVAAANGHIPVIEFLISKGAKVEARDNNNRTPLHRAAENGHVEAVKVLLKAGANIYNLDDGKQTPVHLAAQNNHQKVLQVFLEEEAKRYKNRRNFLHMAAIKDDSKLVMMLLKNGAQVDAIDEKNQTALFHAVSSQHEATVKVLLEHGALIDSNIIDIAFKTNNEKIFGLLLEYSKGLSPDTMISAMFKAVKLNLYGIINALIDKGTDVNATNDLNYTPLLLAAELGKSEAAQAVIEKGADLDVRTPNLNTALHLAVQGGDVSITKLLIRKGININITGPGDQTPIHVAAFHNRQELIDILIEAGADVNVVTKELVTPLHIASQRGNLDLAQRLIHHKAKVNVKDKHSRTPLHIATEGGGAAMVQLLLNNKADPNAADKDKKTPLHFAAILGEAEMVEAMLKNHGRFAAKDMDGCTPLHYAAVAGSTDMVRALLKAGKSKNVDDKNVWRKTPLHQAAEHGHSDVINMLLSNGAAINPLDSNRDTPLHCACKAGHFTSVQTLVGWTQGEKANLQATNSLKKTPLQVAESENTDGHQNITTFLKKKMHLIK
ncbi:ankyrin-3-like [Pelobates cultripes]|uniref:Ankyrin-3-like n=1 Tax=Pelobates cultripes TaxID=61616 RepID=A0AAD1WKH6_PELCU|nr:ankyrin-3-like [Pelobates cultripes]